MVLPGVRVDTFFQILLLTYNLAANFVYCAHVGFAKHRSGSPLLCGRNDQVGIVSEVDYPQIG